MERKVNKRVLLQKIEKMLEKDNGKNLVLLIKLIKAQKCNPLIGIYFKHTGDGLEIIVNKFGDKMMYSWHLIGNIKKMKISELVGVGNDLIEATSKSNENQVSNINKVNLIREVSLRI